jgi:hypothetical protein
MFDFSVLQCRPMSGFRSGRVMKGYYIKTSVVVPPISSTTSALVFGQKGNHTVEFTDEHNLYVNRLLEPTERIHLQNPGGTKLQDGVW